jgi:poly-gamma-glutamate synthesis protein (capsule biosynthesis protein)
VAEAQTPAVLDLKDKGRVIVFSFGLGTSGIPARWAATADGPGVDFLSDLSAGTVRRITGRVQAVKRSGEIAIASIHWGSNWGYEIARDERAFAHALIDEARIDIVHGHSSHHRKAIEVYKGRPILYGCGDFIGDYEGISGYEAFRTELVLMYFVAVRPRTGRLVSLTMVPMRIRRFRLERAATEEARWLAEVLAREGAGLGTRVQRNEDNTLTLSG